MLQFSIKTSLITILLLIFLNTLFAEVVTKPVVAQQATNNQQSDKFLSLSLVKNKESDMQHATDSPLTDQAIKLIFPQLNKLISESKFVGVSGVFAEKLNVCVYKNKCSLTQSEIEGLVVAGFLPIWGKSSSYNIFGHQVTTEPIDISIPNTQDYCDKHPDVCKYNVIIAAYLTYSNSGGFKLAFSQGDRASEKVYTPGQLKAFIAYMKSKNKRVLVSYGGLSSHIDWNSINFDGLKSLIQSYGFDGVNFDLIGTEIPNSNKSAKIAASKIIDFVISMKQLNPDFWLTFSPQWDYILAPVAKNGKDNIYTNDNYINLLRYVGIENINYILLNTYSDKASDQIFSFYKGADGRYLKIMPLDGYDEFLASLAWALTTQEGRDANLAKYSEDSLIRIPADKLVFIIPAMKGAVHSGMVYVLNKQNIDTAISLMKEYQASFAGFALWSIDFDSMSIKKGILGKNYTHKAWSMTNSISKIKLPKVYKDKAKSKKLSNIDKNDNPKNKPKITSKLAINYPSQVGFYTADTIVSYHNKKYKCASSLDLKLCNDKRYIPDSAMGQLVWHKLDTFRNKQIAKKEPKVAIKEDAIVYPAKIGSYKSGQIVLAAGRKFKCLTQKEKQCNDASYSPFDKKGYVAWASIPENSALPESDKHEHVYPEGIKNYKGGEVIIAGGEYYRCRIGPESSLCQETAYSPLGKYGDDAWVRVTDD
ncbi:chitinase [Francisella sp. LA112445]|uniref:chitinase n=1 Tax=Francisella sp. LA112445 TaxID=1395624 RepID=UPI001788D573|nr:chitinase [Francisella sp. LA112445]QIW10890.1 chitinase [Francisella sp. LA112445]